MSKTPQLPSIDAELTAVPRRRLDLAGLKSRERVADDAVTANSQAIGEKWGASTQLAEVSKAARAAPLISMRGYIPAYLDTELHLQSAERRVTKTFLILEALRKAGYHVEDADMVEDRRKSRQGGKL